MRLAGIHNQNVTGAANALAHRKTFVHLPSQVAARLLALRRAKLFSI
jgi:hypothetical protein